MAESIGKVLVIGSSNTDLVVRTEGLPRPGETVLGRSFFTAQGGKGANQAVAASRAGAEVCFIGRVGKDDFGAAAKKALAAEGIDTTYLMKDPSERSGVASILVDDTGENCIVVVPGANEALSPVQLEAARSLFKEATICLLQLETPLETVEHAVELAREHDIPVILNPAPAQPLPDAILENIHILTPNESEAESLTGVRPDSTESAGEAAQHLLDKGVQTVIITLGARGALIFGSGEFQEIPAPEVQPVDTTGAGDAFNGALAAGLARGRTLPKAVGWACCAGALAVTREGAQPSIPSREEIDQLRKSMGG